MEAVGHVSRCSWVGNDPCSIRYHDTEWGVPVYNHRIQFEFLILEGAQAGLSWMTILKRRDAYRRAFKEFDPLAVATMTEADEARLLLDSGIIRNRLKVHAAVTNARAFLAIAAEYGSFTEYIWGFVGGSPLQPFRSSADTTPVRNANSDALAADMKKRGMKFFGPLIAYAHLQATGLINDHTTDCFRHAELS